MTERYPVGVLKDELGNPVGLREFPEGDTLPKSILPPLNPSDIGAELAGTAAALVAGLQQSVNADLDTKVDKVTGKQLSTEDYTTDEKTKLSGIDTGATKNATDADLRDRSTHTGTQAIDTVTGLQGQLDDITLLIGDTSAALDAINGEVI